MKSYFHNVTSEQKLKIASCLIFVSGVLFLTLNLKDEFFSSESGRYDLIVVLLMTGLAFLTGSGLIRKYQWARYLAMGGSILIGGILLVLALVSIFLFLFFASFDIEVRVRTVGTLALFLVTAFPGYILLQPDVKDLFLKRENKQ